MYGKPIRLSLFFSYILLIVLHLTPELSSADNKSFLWKVQSKTGVAYVLGSIHALKKELYPLDKKILDAYNETDKLVVEVNISKIKPETMQKSLLEGSMYSEGRSLRNSLSRKTYGQTEAKLSEYGRSIHQLDMFKPHFIAITLTALEIQKQGFDTEFGIDRYFLRKATRDRKEILELETFDFQADMLSSFSDEEQELFLIYTLTDMDIIGSQLDILIDSWLKGDANTMESILMKSIADRPELRPVYEILINKRNEEMTSKLEHYLATDNSYFVVVGAAHLIGDRGIISLLKEKGYAITQ
ncbi:MAG: TraB/GumN family protein, partial [Thermodesulfovibrionales bacterium]